MSTRARQYQESLRSEEPPLERHSDASQLTQPRFLVALGKLVRSPEGDFSIA